LRKKEAFTLIELLISLLLISILFAIFYKTANTYDDFNLFILKEEKKSEDIPLGKIYIYNEEKIIQYEYNHLNF